MCGNAWWLLIVLWLMIANLSEKAYIFGFLPALFVVLLFTSPIAAFWLAVPFAILAAIWSAIYLCRVIWEMRKGVLTVGAAVSFLWFIIFLGVLRNYFTDLIATALVFLPLLAVAWDWRRQHA